MPILITMITIQYPSCRRCSLATSETVYRTAIFIAETEWIRFIDETSCVGTDSFDFVSFLIFAVVTRGDSLKVISYVFGEMESDGVHPVHFIDEFFK